MSRFIQLHLLTAYPPANLNRDDTGRPKTAIMGGAERLRISSQALKRAWRDSDVFRTTLHGHMGERTQRLGRQIEEFLRENDMPEEQAHETARRIADLFGKIKSEKDKDSLDIEQLAFISPSEKEQAFDLARKALAGEVIEPKSADVLNAVDGAADIAMFGRMLADDAAYNREAAVQVSHALTTHKVVVEDDFYTAIDDLKRPEEDAGAGFMGVQEFAAGLFYLYVCINREQLLHNLGGDEAIANLALEALMRAAATIAPSGKQNSFAAHARALYILAEKGDQQPRSLAPAFYKPVSSYAGQIQASAQALEAFRDKLDAAYGACADESCIMDCTGETAKGSLDDLITFALR